MGNPHRIMLQAGGDVADHYIRADVASHERNADIAAAVKFERERIAWLAEGMANKLHTMDADTVAGCLADLVACLRSDK